MKANTETNLMSGTIATLLLIALCGMFLGGCETTKPPVATIAAITPQEAHATAISNCAKAIADIAIAPGGDATSKVVAVGSLERLCGAGGGQMVAMYQPQQTIAPSLGATLWQAAVQVFDIGARVYGIKAQRDVGITQSNNSRDVAISTNGAFVGMGQSIAQAGTAGYQYIQVPGATYNLSGTGAFNIGNGTATYTGPVTRTCQGGNGQAAAGASGTSTVPGQPGGAAPGGPANC